MRVVVALLLLSSAAAADPHAPPVEAQRAPPALAWSPEHTPYALRLDLDLALLVLGGALWAGTSFVGGASAPPPWCGSSTTPPCDVGGVNALDRIAIGLYSDESRLGANVVAGVVPGAFAILDVADAGVRHWRAWLVDAVVVTEAVVWSGAIQDIVRRAVRRPRPFLYTPGLGGGLREGAEASFSFFSGHTSNTFAMVTAVAFTFSLRHPRSRWQWLVWGLALAGAAVEPILRVRAGDHFPTDCIVGALVGSATGVLVPVLHKKRAPVRFGATSSRDGTTVVVSGAF